MGKGLQQAPMGDQGENPGVLPSSASQRPRPHPHPWEAALE